MNYDSAGLMAQIQALIAAPTSSRSRTNNNKHPYFKRPGRGHNHDTCDACHEAGDLLCCDTCSASFHLMCVNPPLDYEQIPAGDWRCHRCLSTQGDSTGEGDPGKKFPPISRRTGKKRTAPPPTKEPPSKKPTLTSKRITAKGGKVVATFFSQAVELARKMNPEQFVLPKYLMEYGASQFPGAPRPPAKKGASKANKQIIETENGMVPSPIVICFICDVSCRRSPIIKCDACSASFHFECLNPPLTGVPQGRWLCHLHPEPTLEHKTLKSLSFTERVRLYDYAKQPIDPVQVALKFVTKTQRAKYSYFRSKVKIKGKELTQVPGPVVDCYANEDNESELPEWPSFNQLPMYNIWNNASRVDLQSRTDSGVESVSPLDLLAQVAANELRGRNGDDQKAPNPNSLNNGMHRYSTSTRITETKLRDGVDKVESATNSKEDVNMEKAFEALKEKSKSHEGGILDGLDLDTVLLLAAQKMRELICTETIESSSKETQNAIQVGVSKSSNHFYDDRATAIGVNPVGKEVDAGNKIIPLKKPNSDEESQVANDADGKVEKLGSSKDATAEISVPYIKLLIINQQKEIMFKEGEIMIGKGHVALDLTEYVPCPSVTEEHCCIYYDYVGSRWELINYSPNGTVVNKVLYGCEPTMKNAKNISFMDNFHGVKPVPRVTEPNNVIKDENLELSGGCHCKLNQRLQPRESLEMSAYLEVGSRIQVGCIRIMVVDSGCESKLVPRQWLVYNGVSQVPFVKKELSLEPGKKRYQRLSYARSEPGSDDDRENSDSDDVARPAPFKTPKERRKSITRTTIPTRGGTRGRGRGRGRGSLAARRRAESVQNNKELPIKKFSNRGRKRKIPISEPLVVVQSNGTGNRENSIKKEGCLEMDDAIGDHDYGVPTPNRKVQLPESTKEEIKHEPRSGDEISQKKSPGVSG